MGSMFSSTIAAVSTPRGRGGIAVIRISGDEAIAICEGFVFPRVPLSNVESRRAVLCRVCGSDGETLDEAVVTVFRAPHSYTGEDTVEISCHGSEILCGEILRRAFECGAVQAGPGEFTRRAFSAGKLSLTEAEAVIGMIDAKSESALRLSRKNLDGTLSGEIDRIYNKLIKVVGNVYAGIDFPDEDLASSTEDEMAEQTREVISMLEKLRSSYKTGHAVCEGVQTVICGKPNTGKSTLLNLLSGHDRAIVTDIAGTTRDVITDTVVIGDITLMISDTAGIHETSDEIERIGVSRSLDALKNSELVIAVFDSSRELDDEDMHVISLAKEAEESGACVLAVINKSDLNSLCSEKEICASFSHVIRISAKSVDDKKALSDTLNELLIGGSVDLSSDAVVTNARQHASICRALDLCKSAEAAIHTLGTDIAGSELERAMGELSQLDGRSVGIDIVDDIFHRFCVGK